MSDEPTPSFENLLAEIWEQRDAGRPIDLEQYARDYPQLADRLRKHFAEKDWFDDYGDLLTNPDRTDIFEDQTPTPTMMDSVQEGTVLAEKYRLLQKIADGGMGTVWLAQQDAPVKRKVAIKLIKPGMDSRQILLRFEAERQALAMMDHPNIAKVFDAGLTADGRPFFAMEFVKGVPITEYCDANRLTTHQRLELFIPVCQAIQHAHQKGVLHRDIKPSNVLIALYDDKAVPKVIDFGLAKATGQSLTEQTLSTALGAILGTPQYMSPEQATLNNLDIDTRSDVYSLGVLIYELLTGSPPFAKKELEKKGLLEILRVVREEEPPKPSEKLSTAEAKASISAYRSTEPKALTKLLRHELDWVLLKTLEKDRSRRYESANGLALDIQRYLADEIVEARPPSRSYRLRKFIRRQKGTVTAAAAVFIALLGGVVGTSLGLLEAKRGREDAVEARRKADNQKEIAEANANTARDNADIAFSNLYLLGIQRVGRLWEDRNFDAARELLGKLTPEHTGGRDYRQFEWHYWAQRLGNPVRTLPLPSRQSYKATALRTSKDGNQCFILRSNGKKSTNSPLFSTLDSNTGEVIHTWELDFATTREYSGLDIAPDGARIALRSPDNEISVWDTKKKSELFRVRSPKDALAWFDPTSRRILTIELDGTPVLRDTETGRELARFSGQKMVSYHAQFSSDGNRVVLHCRSDNDRLDQQFFKVFNTQSGQVECAPMCLEKCLELAYSPDGQQLAVFQHTPYYRNDKNPEHNELLLYRLNDPKPLVYPIPGFSPKTVGYSLDSTKLFAAGWASHPVLQVQLRVWDTSTGAEQILALNAERQVDWSVAFTTDGRHMLLRCESNRIQVWDVYRLQGEHIVARKTDSLGIVSLAISPHGDCFAVGSDKLAVYDWHNPNMGRVISDKPTYSVAFERNGKRLFTLGPSDKPNVDVLTIWGMPNGERVASWDVETQITSTVREFRSYLAVNPDGNRVAVSLPDRTVHVWDVETRQKTHQFSTKSVVNGKRMEFSPDGLCLTAKLGDLYTWNLQDQSTVMQLVDQGRLSGNVNSVLPAIFGIAYLDNRRLLVNNNKRLYVIDSHTAEELFEVPGFAGYVSQLRKLPGSNRVIGLCSSDEYLEGQLTQSVRVWETNGWAEVLRFNIPNHYYSMDVSFDGSRLALQGIANTRLINLTDDINSKVKKSAVCLGDQLQVFDFGILNDYTGWARSYQKELQDYTLRGRIPDIVDISDSYTTNMWWKFLHAELAYRKAIKVDPQNGSIRLELADLLISTFKPSDARTEFREGLRLAPDHFEGWCRFGSFLIAQKDYREASTALREAIKHDKRPADLGVRYLDVPLSPPLSPIQLHNELGMSLNKIGKFDESETVCRRASQLLDSSKSVYTAQGNSNPDMNSKPDMVHLASNFATSLIQQRKWQEANSACGKLIDQAFSHAINLKFLPDKIWKSGDTSISNLESLNRTSAKHVIEASMTIAQEFLSADRWTETVEWSDRAIRQIEDYSKKWGATLYQVDLALPHKLKAIALNWLGNGKEAVAAIDESIRLSSPNYKPYQRMMRARYVAKTGDHVEAVKLVKSELAKGNANTWDAALAYALCVKAAQGNESLQEDYAKEAVALLKKTLDAKGFQYPWRGDPDLNAIRSRTDFKAVLAEFEKSSKP